MKGRTENAGLYLLPDLEHLMDLKGCTSYVRNMKKRSDKKLMNMIATKAFIYGD